MMQAFISSFQYNHSTGYNYNVGKKRPLPAILTTAAGILVHPLPIKCIGGWEVWTWVQLYQASTQGLLFVPTLEAHAALALGPWQAVELPTWC